MKTTEIPVTGLGNRAYAGIFSGVEIVRNEVIIDVGSGDSRLGRVVPEGTIVQVDPTYGDIEDYDNISFVKLGLGRSDTTKTSAFRSLLDVEATRVTTAHLFHHLHGERKLKAAGQILLLARHGIAQFYPVRPRNISDLTAAAEKRGVELSVTRPPIRNMGQFLFTATGINHTLNILSQPDRMTPRDRNKLTELITPAIF
ncbi:MAG: hypothetical protein ABI354_02290 [Candidatus Saccharimonadales bacterium]